MQFSIRQLALVTMYVAAGLWAVNGHMRLGIILPTILGGAMANHAKRRIEAIIFGVFCANLVGIAAIVVARWLLFLVYSEQSYPLQDDDWRNLVIRIWALSGLIGGGVGSVVAYLVLYARQRRETRHTGGNGEGKCVPE